MLKEGVTLWLKMLLTWVQLQISQDEISVEKKTESLFLSVSVFASEKALLPHNLIFLAVFDI